MNLIKVGNSKSINIYKEIGIGIEGENGGHYKIILMLKDI